MLEIFSVHSLDYGDDEYRFDGEEWYTDTFLEFIDYFSIKVTDWKAVQKTIKSLRSYHLYGAIYEETVAPLMKEISKWVQKNKTAQLHIVLWRSTEFTQDELKTFIDTSIPIHNWSGAEAELITNYIEHRKLYYKKLEATPEKNKPGYSEFWRQEKALAEKNQTTGFIPFKTRKKKE